VRGYSLLQHGSTGLGLLALGFALRQWRRATPPRALPASWECTRPARVAAPWLFAFGVAPAALAVALRFTPPWSPQVLWISFVGTVVVSGISLTFATLCAYALWWRLRAADREATGARHALGE
jgi:ABC-type glycerol-3-phosphate transport system permease component